MVNSTRVRWWVCVAFLGVTLISTTISARAASLSVSYIDCPKNERVDSQLRLSITDRSGKVIFAKTLERTGPETVRSVQVALPAGAYRVVVANGECSDELLVTILEDVDRHVIAVGRSEALLRPYRAMLSGRLPFTGAQIAIVFKGRQRAGGSFASPDGYVEYPAATDGNAYYAVGLPLGKPTVRLYNQGGYRWLDFDAPDVSTSIDSLIRNITTADIKARIDSLAHGKPACVPLKSGLTVCTPPT